MSIKDIRIATGMTQKAFAGYLGIPYRTLQNWENGERKCAEYILELIIYKLKNEKVL